METRTSAGETTGAVEWGRAAMIEEETRKAFQGIGAAILLSAILWIAGFLVLTGIASLLRDL